MKVSNFLCVCSVLLFVGCATVATKGEGPGNTYKATYSIESASIIDVFGKDSDLAAKIGFAVSEVNKNDKYVILTKSDNMATFVGLGTIKAASIRINDIGNNTLQIEIALTGNFGYAKKENADKLFDQIKTFFTPDYGRADSQTEKE